MPKIELRETKFLLGGNGDIVDQPDLPDLPTKWPGTKPEDPTNEDSTNDNPVDVDDPYQGGIDGQDPDQDQGLNNPDDGNNQDPDCQDPDYENPNEDDSGYVDPYDGYPDRNPVEGGNLDLPDLPDIPSELTNDINVNNPNFQFDDSFEQIGGKAINDQPLGIFSSNYLIADLLEYFSNGILGLKIEVSNNPNMTGIAELFYTNENQHVLTFNAASLGQDGFFGLNGLDNTEYDHSGLTSIESLAFVIAPEVIHAKHFAIYQAAL